MKGEQQKGDTGKVENGKLTHRTEKGNKRRRLSAALCAAGRRVVCGEERRVVAAAAGRGEERPSLRHLRAVGFRRRFVVQLSFPL